MFRRADTEVEQSSGWAKHKAHTAAREGIHALQGGTIRTSDDVRQRIVMRMLGGMGWDPYDPGGMLLEAGGIRLLKETSEAVEIEVKAPGEEIQPSESLEPLEVRLVTDGSTWSLWRRGQAGEAQRECERWSLQDMAGNQELAERLGPASMKRGELADRARRRYQAAEQQARANAEVGNTILDVLGDKDSPAWAEVRERIRQATGTTPTEETVRTHRELLLEMLQREEGEAAVDSGGEDGNGREVYGARAYSWETTVDWEGQKRTFPNQTEAMVFALERIEAYRPGTLEACADDWQAGGGGLGRKAHHLCRRPDLGGARKARQFRPVGKGAVHVFTNFSRADKKELVAEVAKGAGWIGEEAPTLTFKSRAG